MARTHRTRVVGRQSLAAQLTWALENLTGIVTAPSSVTSSSVMNADSQTASVLAVSPVTVPLAELHSMTGIPLFTVLDLSIPQVVRPPVILIFSMSVRRHACQRGTDL